MWYSKGRGVYNMKDALFVIFMCWVFLLTMFLKLIFEGVKLMLKLLKVYWPVFILVALVFYFVAPRVNFNTTDTVTEPVVQEQEVCKLWDRPVDIEGHLAHIEICLQRNKETYRLYVGNELLQEEVYVNGVFLSRSINSNLLQRLQKSKPKEKKPTLTTKDITNARKDI